MKIQSARQYSQRTVPRQLREHSPISGAACNFDVDCFRDSTPQIIRTHYCDADKLTCQPLEQIGGECTSNYNCSPNLYCNNGVCANFTSSNVWAITATVLASIFGIATLSLSLLLARRKKAAKLSRTNSIDSTSSVHTLPRNNAGNNSGTGNGYFHPPAYAPTSPPIELTRRISNPTNVSQEFTQTEEPTQTWAYPTHRNPSQSWQGDESVDVGPVQTRQIQPMYAQQMTAGQMGYSQPQRMAVYPDIQVAVASIAEARWVDEKARGGITDTQGEPIQAERGIFRKPSSSASDGNESSNYSTSQVSDVTLGHPTANPVLLKQGVQQLESEEDIC
jgi:hypothetical protein